MKVIELKTVEGKVRCSWMNQIEQWFGILKRKRLTISNFKYAFENQMQLWNLS